MFELPPIGKIQDYVARNFYKPFSADTKFALDDDDGQEEIKIFADCVRTAMRRLPHQDFVFTLTARMGPVMVRTGYGSGGDGRASFITFDGQLINTVFKDYNKDIDRNLLPWRVDRSAVRTEYYQNPKPPTIKVAVRATQNEEDEFVSTGFWKVDDKYQSSLRVREGKFKGRIVFRDSLTTINGKTTKFKYCIFHNGYTLEVKEDNVIKHMRFKADPNWVRSFEVSIAGVNNGQPGKS